MESVLHELQTLFLALPDALLQVWGLWAYLVGWVLLVFAYGNLTLRPGGRWGIGWRRQEWDDRDLKGALVTFLAILVTGYLGSKIVLVDGAQTFESLKDLSVFVCLSVFGYPALLMVPFAYGLSDLIEGVPPDFLLNWLPGYWINPSYFWLGILMLGRAAQWGRASTWGRYLGFVAVFLALEPALWGWICADKYPGGISYYQITPALLFTTTITWLLAPVVLIPLGPWLRRHHASRPQREYDLLHSRWVDPQAPSETKPGRGLALRSALVVPVVALILLSVAATAYITLSSGTTLASRLADQLHQEQTKSLVLELDNWFEAKAAGTPVQELATAVAEASASWKGRVYLLEGDHILTTTGPASGRDEVLETFHRSAGASPQGVLTFDVVKAEPLSRETWMARVSTYQPPGGAPPWRIVIALPASIYLGGIQDASSQVALLLTWALILALGVVVLFSTMFTAPVERIIETARAMAAGSRSERVRGSQIRELNDLTVSFNAMEDQIQQSLAKLRASEAEFRNILDGALEGFYRTSMDGRLLMVNPALARILGYASADQLLTSVRNTGLQIWPHPEDRTRFIAEVLRVGKVQGSEEELIRADGSRLWGSVSARIVRDADGREAYLEGFLLDITDRKLIDLELQQHRQDLEVLVERRTQELVEARDEANRANQAKSSFLSNMSHEIRSPMNAVLGFAQLLHHDDHLPAAARDKVATILRSGEHLMSIIDEILEMARIESGRVQLREGEFDLAALLDDVVLAVRPQATAKGLVLESQIGALPPSLLGDQVKVRQVVANLLSNAVKYTPQGSVLLRASFGEDQIHLEVEDTGIGLDEAEQRAIFQPFERTARGEASAGGTGLGLSICQQYATLMGGEITVQSRKGSGSRFGFTFPVRLGTPVVVRAPSLPRFPVLDPSQKGRRVLIVDDQELNRDLLAAFLEPLGVPVEVAASGPEALEKAQVNPPSVVLLDLRMPGWDGLETARRLRELPGGSEFVLLGVSASAFDRERKGFFEAGLNGFLAKPFREEDFYGLLAERAGFRFLPPKEAPHSVVVPPWNDVDDAWLNRVRSALAMGNLSQLRTLAASLGPSHTALSTWLQNQLAHYDLDAIRRHFGSSVAP